MKKREILLDFTSLLDVVLIMLFFFILFGSLDVEQAKTSAQEKEAEYNEKVNELESERIQLEQEYLDITQSEIDRLNEEYIQRTQTTIYEAETEKRNAQELAATYEEKLAELDEMKQQEERHIGILEGSNDASISLRKEVINYIDGTNFKLILDMDGENWRVKAKLGEIELVIDGADDISNEITGFLKDNGYCFKSTVLCDFIYDGSLPNTNRACKIIRKSLNLVKTEFESFYFSETNLS